MMSHDEEESHVMTSYLAGSEVIISLLLSILESRNLWLALKKSVGKLDWQMTGIGLKNFW